jgi:hypothetical protein
MLHEPRSPRVPTDVRQVCVVANEGYFLSIGSGCPAQIFFDTTLMKVVSCSA